MPWIGVNDRLPELGEIVLAEGSTKYKVPIVCKFMSYGFSSIPGYYQIRGITHWRPIHEVRKLNIAKGD